TCALPICPTGLAPRLIRADARSTDGGASGSMPTPASKASGTGAVWAAGVGMAHVGCLPVCHAHARPSGLPYSPQPGGRAWACLRSRSAILLFRKTALDWLGPVAMVRPFPCTAVAEDCA